MEKELPIQCVPAALLARLKALAERLWADNNPSSVHLNAILEEFSPDVKALGQVVSEYEADCSGRLAAREAEHATREARLKDEIRALKEKGAELEKEDPGLLAKIAELKAAVRARDERLDELQAKAAEQERELNLKYVAKMQELYEQINEKELGMLAKWEEKSKKIEARAHTLEEEYDKRARELEQREKALEEDAKARKAEFLHIFDHIRAELEARGQALAAHERSLAYWEKNNARREGRE
ncbi:MAG TPA: hypothetical protein PKI19_01930 [Elusimicrobiales bacterium]|nr:hypothetical protein [Elusimicrobiales bacterium]